MSEILDLPVKRRWGAPSPLRYPGGKASLAGLFADIIGKLGLKDPTYVEPYAGGAGAGIALLRQGIVSRLIINDFDKAVHAFWKCVVNHNSELVGLIKEVTLTVEEWRRQKSIYTAMDDSDVLALGFAFFYLNRTNRSGVLKAGVIGGVNQDGNYLIDARFKRDTLVDRIEALGALSERIIVTRKDGRTTIREHQDEPNTFLYIDPPYVKAGARLYLNSFAMQDHEALAEVVDAITAAPWLLTYDVAPVVAKLYASQFQSGYSLNYSSHHPGQKTELLIASPDVALVVKELSVSGRAV